MHCSIGYKINSFWIIYNASKNDKFPKSGMAIKKVYDVLGREIKTLVNREKIAGYYRVEFNAAKLASGT